MILKGHDGEFGLELNWYGMLEMLEMLEMRDAFYITEEAGLLFIMITIMILGVQVLCKMSRRDESIGVQYCAVLFLLYIFVII